MGPTAYPLHASRTTAHVDLHSREANDIAKIEFIRSDEHHHPIVLYRCLNPVGLCALAKEWHYNQFGYHNTPGLLRMDTQDLYAIDNSNEGTLVVLERAAGVAASGQADKDSMSIMALLMPKDSKIRFFYSIKPYHSLIAELDNQKFTCFQEQIAPISMTHKACNARYRTHSKDMHCRIFTFLYVSFLQAYNIPDAPEFLQALQLTDYAPDILDPDTSLRRIEKLAGDQQFPIGNHVKDLSDDRYLLELEPAERELASVTDLRCAEYLLVKRVFFKDYFDDVMRTEKQIGTMRGRGRHAKPVRVRTETAHLQWFERVYGWGARRAKRLVSGWEVLGLLDEKRLLPWIKAGGMLAHSELLEDVEDQIDGTPGTEPAE